MVTSSPLVRQQGDQLITTSLAISQHFGRKHKDVLRAIEHLDCSQEFARRNFTPCSYSDGNQRQRPMHNITRDGFMFLCMGFTGSQAARWKERYIEAFNTLEREASKQQLTGLDVPAYIRRELLQARPIWKQIMRYKGMGLNQVEIGKLLGCSTEIIRQQVRKMERCNLLQPPKNLVQMQQGALRLQGGA